MKITRELLEKYEACKDGIEFLDKFYPDGAEALQIAEEHELPLEMLHFARQFFNLDEKELQKYSELCEVDEDCTNVWRSSKVYASKNISSSININESNFVYDSTNVFRSSDVYSSEEVEESHNVFGSKGINSSEFIVNCEEVEFSSQLVGCENISWSENLIFSFGIEESSFLYTTKNSRNSYFSGFLTDCQNCLFCYGLNNVKNYIFNQPVSENEFEIWKEKLLFMLNREQNSLVKINHQLHSISRFQFYTSITSIFKDLSSDFFGWVGSIPYYDENLFINLFFKY